MLRKKGSLVTSTDGVVSRKIDVWLGLKYSLRTTPWWESGSTGPFLWVFSDDLGKAWGIAAVIRLVPFTRLRLVA